MELYLTKSITMDRFRTQPAARLASRGHARIGTATERRARFDAPKKRSSAPPSPRPSVRFGELEASSARMCDVFATLARLAPSEITVMLTGDTGTGKSLLARSIHAMSARARGPFVTFECGAMEPNLVEAELFGREQKSATPDGQAGAFERARGGTLFLDEVCELPLELQPRLLRVLESRSVRRSGSTEDRPVDVRILAASQRDLKQRVEEGAFREDLYFRLASTVVAVPPLRDRMDDLSLVVDAAARESRPGRPCA